jgi:L-seryl-tRNA(Ser) seleniumtransferase
MRPDKAILAGVAATLAIYRGGRARRDIPVWEMIGRDAAALRERAQQIVATTRVTSPDAATTVVELRSPVGGGSLPGQTLPSFGVSVAVRSAARAAARLRRGPDRILARIVDEAIVFDLRTVSPEADGEIARRIGELEEVPR